jgi:hypothetical protein
MTSSNLQIMNDDWGWFIDIENNSITNNFQKIITSKKNITFKKLTTIKEDEDDEYEFYKKNTEEIYDFKNENEKTKINEYNYFSKITFTIFTFTFCIMFYNFKLKLNHSC